MTELELNKEIVRSIVDKAREFHSREDVTFPEEPDSADEDWAQHISIDHSDDPYYQELRNLINDLEPDQQMTLVALMWVGRGDYAFDEWGDAVAYAEEHWTKHTAEYLIGTALLADYLAEGLTQFEVSED